MLQLHYFADIKRTLYDPTYRDTLALMRRAGVTTLWPIVSMTGRFTASKPEILSAKQMLGSLGFATGALILPVGHPGNSLNPEEELDLALPDHWRYRIDPDGKPAYFCACVEENMLADNIAAVEFCREAGFDRLFFDDDLRMGNYSKHLIRGCFCDHCVREFSDRMGTDLTREQIAFACEHKTPLSEDWIAYNCAKITRFMKATALPGIRTGIMVMVDGGRYHGIDLPAIQKAVPDCLIRVGEGHFCDAEFDADPDHAGERDSMRAHFSLIEAPQNAYSETTVFPPNALSPQNLVKKITLAKELGIQNIFLMSGTWVMTGEYWLAIGRAMHPEA